MSRPLVDITTLNAVESLFRRGLRDPWAKQLAGELADLVIYSDIVRYSITVPGGVSAANEVVAKPSILAILSRRDASLLMPEEYSAAEPILLRNEYLGESFDRFCAWARANWRTLQRWITLHDEGWIQMQRAARVHHQYVFSLDALRGHAELQRLSRDTGIPEASICYAFDIVLRYPLYGELVGEDEYYLSHPIRDAFTPPTMRLELGKPPEIAVSFHDCIASLADNLSLDEYTALLHELRGLIRLYGLHKVGPGEFDKDVVREIAAKVALPPRLKASGKLGAAAAALISGVGALPALGPPAALVGAAVSISTLLWEGRLPRPVARVGWLRWAVGWDVEDQSERRE